MSTGAVRLSREELVAYETFVIYSTLQDEQADPANILPRAVFKRSFEDVQVGCAILAFHFLFNGFEEGRNMLG
jgi:hypothetical protein